MKSRFFILLFGMALFGCSSDDNSGNNNNGTNDFLPQDQGNYWVYDVNSDEFSGRDSLYVSGTTTSQGNTYYTYLTSEVPNGFYSGLMTSGQSRVSDSKIFMTGEINIGDVLGDFIEVPSVELVDFVIFDGGASQGATLDSESGSFTIPYNGFDILVEYTLSAKAGQKYPNYTVSNGDSYENVQSVTIAVSAKISTSVFGFPVTILSSQDVISSTQYYANNVGVVFVNTDFQYQMNAVPGFELPIPQNFQSNTTEVLDSYLVE